MDILKDIYNGFEICVDWLEFTLKIDNIVSACSLVGLNFLDFVVRHSGALGYSKYGKHKYCSISIFWNGSENMGTHFRVSGSSVPIFFQYFIDSRLEDTPFGDKALPVDNFLDNYFSLLFSVISENGKLTRLDLALDDYTGSFYNTETILSNLNNCLCVSKFRDFKSIVKRKICDNTLKGHTLYFGSVTSDIMLRVYDKKLEKDIDIPFWNRWEFEIRDDKANDIVSYIIERKCIGSLFSQLLNNYIRLINDDNVVRTRCSTQNMWIEFVSTLDSIRLSIHKSIKTINSKQEWLEKQCYPTLAGLIKFYDGDMSFLYDKMEGSYLRNNMDNKMLFEKEVEYVIQ